MSILKVTSAVPSSIRFIQRGFTMKVSTLSLAVFAAFGLAVTAHAQVQSDIVGATTIVNVGATAAGLPGIGHIGAYDGALISFEQLQGFVDDISVGNPTNWKLTKITPAQTIPNPPGYGDIGYFDFIQVANESVYFGEWSKTGVSSDSTHTVYYAGEAGNVVNTLPTQTATYTVVGINNGGILNGSLTANFGGNNQLVGSFFNSDLTIDIAATINTADASFSGGALANGIEGTFGTTKGHFFGNEATALAGITEFASDRSLNTAFGGLKD